MVFHKRDRYQRILGKVLVNGADAGLDPLASDRARDRAAPRGPYPGRERRPPGPQGLLALVLLVPPWNFRKH